MLVVGRATTILQNDWLHQNLQFCPISNLSAIRSEFSWSKRETVNPEVVAWIPAKNQKTENSNLHGFQLHILSSKDTKLLFQIIKAVINPSRLFMIDVSFVTP